MTEGAIYKAIPAIMAKIGYVGKDHQSTQKYSYRAVDDVLAAIQPLMAEAGIFVYPRVTSVTCEMVEIGKNKTPMMHVLSTIEYHFCASDGSEIVAATIGEATDTADKAGNKAMASAYKYAVTQTFSIPTSEAKDTELTHPELTNESSGPDMGYADDDF